MPVVHAAIIRHGAGNMIGTFEAGTKALKRRMGRRCDRDVNLRSSIFHRLLFVNCALWQGRDHLFRSSSRKTIEVAYFDNRYLSYTIPPKRKKTVAILRLVEAGSPHGIVVSNDGLNDLFACDAEKERLALARKGRSSSLRRQHIDAIPS